MAQSQNVEKERLAAFGAALREERLAAGLTQGQLGKAVNLTGSSVGQWEAGLGAPSPTTVFRVEENLQLPAGRLSRLLGYGPPEVKTSDVIDAIRADKRLSREGKDALVTLYRHYVGRSGARK